MTTRAAIFSRFVLCDLLGRSISLLSAVSSQKQMAFPLNRAARLSFTVPSDNQVVNYVHTDGFPYLSAGNRTIKGWRRTEGGAWTLRYNGLVWDLQDVADGLQSRTAVNVYDPMQRLTRRLVRAADGKVYKTVHFNGGDVDGLRGDQIAKQMVDRTIQYAGPCGLSTDLGVFTVAPKQSASFDQEYVAPALIKLCDTGLLDITLTPQNRTDGIMCAFSAGPRRGDDKPNVLISYAAPGRTAYSLDRVVSMDTFANDIRLWGGSTTGHLAHVNEEYKDADVAAAAQASIDTYGRYEDAQVLTDVHTGELVDALALEEFELRKDPRDMLTILPTPGLAAAPFTQYFTGDTVRVMASVGSDQASPQTRQAIGAADTSLQRIYGISIDVDDNGVERVAGLDVSPQGL